MSEEARLRGRAASEGARLLALRYLDEATQAVPRLTDPNDAESLHDFRVGLRRLRSVLRAYRRELSDTVRGKDRDLIATIARGTNDGRDAEVQLLWLEKRFEEAPAKMRAGLEWLLPQVRTRMDAGYTAARGDTSAHFAKAERTLRERLSYYDVRVQLGEPVRQPSFGEITADLLREHVGDLVARHALVTGAGEQENIHNTRIAAKRLRYLLEPLKGEVEGAGSLVKRLKDLQDVLGELHDMHVIGLTLAGAMESAVSQLKRDECDGLLWLTEAARNDRDRLYAHFQKSWSTEHLTKFVDQLRAAADDLGKRDDIEIERKYLLKAFPREVRKAPFDQIEQGYLPGERLLERIRRVRGPEGERYYRTMKFGSGMVRTEIEEETSADLFKKLWPLTRGKRVIKRRYTVANGSDTWVFDVFRGRKLVLCEIEVESESRAIVIPEWLSPYVVRDVTDESEYTNVNLAS